MGMEYVGVGLGFLIGLITGFALVTIANVAYSSSPGHGALSKTLGAFFSIPTFWFGSPWISTKTLQSIDWATVLPYYVMALACTFGPFAIVVLVRATLRVGRLIDSPQRSP